MRLVQKIRDQLHEVKNEDLKAAISDLRELGDMLEKKDPHFFEQEKFNEILKQARQAAKEL